MRFLIALILTLTIASVASAQSHNCPYNVSSGYQRALASAQYRADRCIKGHTRLDMPGAVGFSTSNPMPRTCWGVGGRNYAVVRGRDGWYASKVP